MACIVADNIFKSYENVKAVDGVSFKVEDSEIFGLLGPNGAGKSTIIRMLLDLIKPDKGNIELLGGVFSEKTKGQVGYLPEERGLYDNISVMENLVYLATLKGTDPKEAMQNAAELLARVALEEKANNRVNTLSKGQRQLVQLCLTLVHKPNLLILDEPFTGLDPSNRELVKKIILEERKKGKTVILSTHMMNEVEEVCDHALMINHGRRVLYGEIENIKGTYASHSIFVEFEGMLPKLEGLDEAKVTNNTAELFLRIDTTPKDILRQLVEKNVSVTKFDVKELSLNQIFIKVVEAEKWIK